MTGEAQPQRDTGRTFRRRRVRRGVVVSAAGDKTIRVIVDHLIKHPKYGKYMRRRTKLAAHDPVNAARAGDVVEIVPCRRMSKTKSWRLARVVRRSLAAPGGVAGAEPGPPAAPEAAPAEQVPSEPPQSPQQPPEGTAP